MAEGDAPGCDTAPAEETDVEGWAALTQSSLGRFVEKPRLMADRLRKPPFRFLFDIAVEVARQTGFGYAELFGSSLPAKPAVPGDRDSKMAFLEQWVHLLQWKLGPPISGDLTNCQASNIVCGVKPEWTNYMLQCTAAAAWPEHCAAPPRAVAAEPAPLWQAPALVPLEAEASQLQPALEPLAGPSDAPACAEQPAYVEQPAYAEQPTYAEQPAYAEQQAALEEQAAEFGTALDQFESLHKDFAATAEKWSVRQSSPTKNAQDEDDDSSTDGENVESARASPDASAAYESAARAPLTEAKNRAARVDEEMRHAEDLLAQIEEGFDRTDAMAQTKRAQAQESLRQAEADAAAAQQDAEAHEAAAADEKQRQKAEKRARKAARKAQQAEEERLQEEEAAKPVYPVSKHAMTHGARIVSMLGGDDEYADDFDEEAQEKGAEGNEMMQEDGIAAPAGHPVLEGAAAFDLDAVLGADPRAPISDMPFWTAPVGGASALFEQLKVQLKETYISYLCASMPSFLLKQYQPGELVGCLQFLLTELRKHVAQHGLQDVGDEEPTTLAEDLHEKFPSDWLLHVLDPSALTICGGKYDIPELIDTLQSLSQICVDRLEDSLGPIQSFVDESDPLRYIPPAEPVRVPTPPPAEEELSVGANSGYSDGPGGQWPAQLSPAPWEAEPAPVMPMRHAGMASTMGDFRNAKTSSGSRAAPPTFDATLGPAIWEQDLPPAFPVTSAGPHAMRHATAAPGGRGPPPKTAFGGMSAHPATSHGVPRRPVTGQYPAHYVASR